MKYFLAPRSGEKSYQNFLSTIKHGVPFERIEPFLNPEGKNILRQQEVIYSWGNREARSGDWKKMETGDLVIFYAQKNLVMAGDIIYKQHSPQLALAMWPPDDVGNPWEYTFFINNLRYFKIPIETFNFIADYNFKAVMGFQEITPTHVEKILGRYGSFVKLFEAFKDEDSKEIPLTEPVYVNLPKNISPTVVHEAVIPYQEKELGPSKKKNGVIDFTDLNNTKSKIGSTGEEVVLQFEKDYLMAQGRKDLAEKVKRVSLENMYCGYDIVSYDEKGKEKLIEVKSTSAKLKKDFVFHISSNERKIAEESENYFIYLVLDAKSTEPKIKILAHPFKTQNLSIRPTQFLVKGSFVR